MKTKMNTKTTELRMIIVDLNKKLVRRTMRKITKTIMTKMMFMMMRRKRKKSSNHLPKNNKNIIGNKLTLCLELMKKFENLNPNTKYQ